MISPLSYSVPKFYRILKSKAIEKNLKDVLVPTPLPCSGMPHTRSSFSGPHPAWPWSFSGIRIEHPWLLQTKISISSSLEQRIAF